MEARGPARKLIATRIFDLLAVEKVLGRRYLQTHLVGNGGFQPEHITDTLEVLVDSGKLERTYGAGVGCTFHMYSLPGADRVAVKRCERDIVLGHKIQRAAKLGEVGETYVRAIMLRSESFFRIPQKKRMGKIRARGGKRIDMSARLKWAPQIRVVIEVKNEYEVFPQSDPVFWHLASTAMTEDCFPILAAVNVSNAARIMCKHLGIAVLELGRQIFPKSLKNIELSHLEKAFGPQPYEQVESRRPLHRPSDITTRIQHDIDFLMGRDQIMRTFNRWRVTQAQLGKARCSALEEFSLDQLVRLRQFYRSR